MLAALVLGCGGMPQEDSTPEAAPSLGETAQPLSTEGYEYSWQTGQAPVALASSEHFCFITSVSGDFDGSTYVEIYDTGWPVRMQYLQGGGNGWASVKARCIYQAFTSKVQFSVTVPPGARDQTSRVYGPTICGLSRVGGRFASPNDSLSLNYAGEYWWLWAIRSSDSLLAPPAPTATATCLNDDIGMWGWLWMSADWTQDGSVQKYILGAEIQSDVIERTCMLGSLGGNFRGGGEYVSVGIEDGQWYLTGGSMQTGLRGRAICFDAP